MYFKAQSSVNFINEKYNRNYHSKSIQLKPHTFIEDAEVSVTYISAPPSSNWYIEPETNNIVMMIQIPKNH